MVAAGNVRARVVCSRLCLLGMILGACVCVACLSDFACILGSWICFDVEECAGCAWGDRVCWVGAMLWCECGV